jgi:hypothetical protein
MTPEPCTLHADYLAHDPTGEPKPDLLATVRAIRAENPRIGGDGAMRRATDMIRHWAVANGFAN